MPTHHSRCDDTELEDGHVAQVPSSIASMAFPTLSPEKLGSI